MKNDFDIKNAPPNDPKAFGKLLDLLIQELFPNKNLKRDYLLKFSEKYGIAYDRVKAWTNGRLNLPNTITGRTLTPSLFTVLVTVFWSEKVLTSVEEVQSFARCAGKYKDGDCELSYEALLNNDWFRQLAFPSNNSPIQKYISDSWITRQRVMDRLNHEIRYRRGKTVILSGQPGAGKTTLLSQLENDEETRRFFGDRVFSADLDGKKPINILNEWYLQSTKLSPPWNITESKLANELKNLLKDKHILLLLDGVSNADEILSLLIQDPSKGVVVVSAQSPKVIADLGPDAINIHIPRFNQNEADEYLQKTWKINLEPHDQECYQQIVTWLNGNPLALKYAVYGAKKVGWDVFLASLQEENHETLPDLILPEIYEPLRRIYNNLLEDEKRSFRALAALPSLRDYDAAVFSSLWKYPINQTRILLEKLVSDIGVLTRGEGDGEESWNIHQQTHMFAKYVFKIESSENEQSKANGWLERYENSREIRARLAGFFNTSTSRSFSQALKLEASVPSPNMPSRQLLALQPANIPEWETVQENKRTLSSIEYGLACSLRRKEIFFNKIYLGFFILASILIVAALITGLAFNQVLVGFSLLAMSLLLAVCITNLYFYQYRRYRAHWYWLLKQIIERSTPQKTDLPSEDAKQHHRLVRALLPRVLLVLALLPAITAPVYQAIASVIDKNAYPPQGQIVEVNGTRMHLSCTGTGETTYILESSFYGWSITWEELQKKLSLHGVVCSYDRVGFGWSESNNKPQTSDVQAATLYQLLKNSAIDPPYILISDETGAQIAYQFANRFPEAVEGIVFLSPITGRQFREAEILNDTLKHMQAYRFVSRFGYWRFKEPLFLDIIPEGARPAYRAFASTPTFYQTLENGIRGALDFQEDMPPDCLGDLPVLVLTPETFPAQTDKRIVWVWKTAYADNSRWSTETTRIPVPGSAFGDPAWKYSQPLVDLILLFTANPQQ